MKSRSSNIPLLAVTLVVAFVLFESSLALFWPHKILSRPYHEQYHPLFGWANRPWSKGSVRVSGARDVFFSKSHNVLGLRSTRETTYEKPPGVKRILLLGDSYFWGYGVDDKDVVSEVLQGLVDDKVEIINGSTMGYATDQELLWLAEEGVKFLPDLVVLGVFPGNDFEDIGVSIMMGYPKPFFALVDGKLTLRNVPVPDTTQLRRKAFGEPSTAFGKLKKFLRHHTHTYPFIAGRLNSVPSLRAFFLRVGLAEEYTRSLEGIPFYRLKEDGIPVLFESLTREIKAVSEETGSGFLLVHIPEKEQDPLNPIGYEGARDGAYSTNDMNSSYLENLTERNSMSYLDLLPVMRKHYAQGEFLYVKGAYDHHWNPLGHRVAAKAIYEWMESSGMP